MKPGERLREIRQARGLTLTSLASMIRHPDPSQRISPGILSRFELGQRTLTPDWRRALADALDVPPTEFA